MSAPVQPDLHHKMSKKIAQLTKVIYHLNTVNEDNTFSTETRAKSHQNELTTILKDASSKINKFRDIVEEKRSAVNAEAELTQLKTKHDKEKAAAHDKIKSIQLNFDTRYDTLRDECSQKILDLRDEAATYKAKLAECIRTFEDKQRQLREAYDKNKGVAGNEVEAMKRKHQQEIAEHVQSANEKFQNMLVEQMTLQETLTSTLNLEKKQALSSAAEAAAAALKKLTADTNASYNAKIDGINRNHAAEVEKLQNDFASKMEKAVRDITLLKTQISDYEKQLEQAASLQKLSEAEIDKLKITIRQLKDQLSQSGSQSDKVLAALREENADLNQKTEMLDDQILTLQKQIQTNTAEFAASKKSLMRQLGDAHETIERLKAAGGDSGKEIELLTSQLMQAEQDVEKLKADVKQSNATIAAKEEELINQKRTSDSEISDLQAQIASLTKAMNSSSGDLQGQIEALKNKVEETKLQGIANVKTAEEQFDQKLAAFETKLEQDMAALSGEHSAVVKGWEAKVSNAVTEGEKNVMGANQKTAEMKVTGEKNVANAIKDGEARLNKLQKEWDEERNQLNKRIADLSANSAAETDLLKGDVGRFKKQTAELTAELEKNKTEVAKLNGIAADLKKQIDELRKELEANANAANAKLELELKKLREHYEGLMGKNDESNTGVLMKMEIEMKEKMEEELRKLREELEAIIAEERLKVGEMEEAKGKVEGELEMEKKDHQVSVERLAKVIKELEASGKEGMEKMIREHKEELEGVQKRLEEEHNGRMEDSKRQEERLKAEILAKHDEEKRRLDEEAKEKLEKEMREAAEKELRELKKADVKLKEELAALEKKLAEQHGEVVGGLVGEHAKGMEELGEAKRGVEGELEKEKGEKAGLGRDLSEAKLEIERLAAEMEMKGRQMEEDRELERAEGRREIEGVRSYMEEQRKGEVARMEGEMAELEGVLKGEIGGLRAEIEGLEERYLARESREEDIARIQELEREMVEKDALVKKTKEEMVYFKRELLNREENFNKKFNSNVNVGVMNVIKPSKGGEKGGRGGGKGDRRRSSSGNNGNVPPVPPSGPQFGF